MIIDTKNLIAILVPNDSVSVETLKSGMRIITVSNHEDLVFYVKPELTEEINKHALSIDLNYE